MANMELKMQPPSDPSVLPDWVEKLSHQVEREDGLVNQRVTWMIQLEGFLFAGLALKHGEVQKPLLLVLSVIGITSAFTTLRGVRAARRALDDLVEAFESIPQQARQYLVRPFGQREHNDDGKVTSAALPIVIIIAWVGLVASDVLGPAISHRWFH